MQIKSKTRPSEYNALAVKKALFRFSKILWKIFRTFLLTGLCFVLLYPLIYMVVMTFRPSEEVLDPTVIWISKSLTLENLKNAVQVMDYKNALLTSLQINVGSTIMQVLICAVVGYGFARFEFKGKKILFVFVIMTILIPPQITVTPLFMTYKNFSFLGVGKLIGLFTGEPLVVNLLNTPLTFYLPAILGMGLKSGLIIFLFRQFFRGLPKELEDAASIDGCGFFSIFMRIMIPNAASVFLVTFILSLVWYWNDYYISSMFMNNLHTVSTALAKLKTTSAMITGNAAQFDPYAVVTLMQAGCLLTIAPVLAVYVVCQKYFVQGVERSGLVG